MSNVLRFKRRRHRRPAPRLGRLLLSYAAAIVVAVLVGVALTYTTDYFFHLVNSAPGVTHGLNATAIDGDSLRVGGQDIRLIGIDAPELAQTCHDEHDAVWACGREAQAHLRSLVSRGSVDCVAKSKDQYGRMLATCSVDSVGDIGAAMVRAGYAVNFMNGGYKAAEAEARAASRGIWRGSFERPQDWRRRQH